MPEFTVTFDEAEIRCLRPDGSIERAAWANLRAVMIEANAAEPFGSGWTWILVEQGSRCVIPGDAAGSDLLLERFQDLSGFDNDTFIEAMSSAEARRFVCWKRGDAPAGEARAA